ncbi:hypothetical protein J6590_038351 [Homalodisca vitripennis]|nr:hypothetical protein J6590_038351 [Homalodisca vitripennis]
MVVGDKNERLQNVSKLNMLTVNYFSRTRPVRRIGILDGSGLVHSAALADPSNSEEPCQSVPPRKRGRRASTSSESSTAIFVTAQKNPEPNVGECRQQRIPPLIVQGVTAWTSLLRHLRSLTAQRELLDAKLAFHTFSLKEEQELKTVIRGLPAWTSTEDIAEDLRDRGFTPTHVAPLQRHD